MKLISRFSALAAAVLVFGCGDELAPPTTGSIALDIRVDQTPVLSRAETGSVSDTSVNDSAQQDVVPRFAVAAFTAARATTVGPTAKTVNLELVDGFWEGELTALQPGEYQVLVEGLVDGEIDHLGLAAGVTVVAGQAASSSVTLVSFRPTIAVGLSSPTRLLTIPLTIGTVAAAETYRVEWARNPEFTGASGGDFDGPALVFTAVDTATYYFRARAVIGTVRGRASDPASITILGDAAATGDDPGSALYLGAGVGNINQTIGDLNIAPPTDEDWFSLDACQEDTLVVETFAKRLTPASELDTYLRLFDSGSGLVAENDDIDASQTDSYLETVLTFDDTYYVQASSFSQGSAGHYEIAFELRPGPYNLGATCAPGPATVVVTPDTTLTAIDDQVQMTVQVFNQGGGLLNPGDYILTWDTDAPSVVDVSPTGLVTALDNGAATISVDAVRSAPAGAEDFAAGAATGFATVTVQQVADLVEVSPSGATVSGLGSMQSFTAVVLDANGNPITSPSITWLDLNADVATVDASGNATAQRDGQATIAAEVDGVRGYGLLTIENPSTTPVNVWGQDFVPLTGSEFRGVWGVSEDEVYAAGGSPFEIFRWDGVNWNLESHEFNGVAGSFIEIWGSASDDIFMVGQPLAIVHFDGISWDSVPVPATAATLWDIWGSGPEDVFVSASNTLGAAAIFHYDGVAWNEMPNPSVGSNMYSIWGFAWDDVFAVSDLGEVLHYDGSNWSFFSSPGSIGLVGVWGVSASDFFVMGFADSIFHYDGAGWTGYPTPGDPIHYRAYGASTSDAYFTGFGVTRFDGAVADVTPLPSAPWGAWGTGAGPMYLTGLGPALRRGVRGGSVSITAGPDTLFAANGPQQYLAKGFDAVATPLDTVAFIWESRDTGVFTVNSNGLVTPSANGTTWLVATAPGGAADSLEVTSIGFASVLILGNNIGGTNYNAAAYNALSGLAGITIDSIDTQLVTPTLAQLNNYSVVLVYENGVFATAPNIGDSVAAYVQGGGNVVIGTFYWQERSDAPFARPGWGALEAVDPFLAPQGAEYAPDAMDVASIVPHPLTAGVSSFTVGSASGYHGGVAAKGDATVVAAWSDGTPFIGYREETGGQRLVAVSTWPAYDFQPDYTGDFVKIWENAFRWAGAGGAFAPAPSRMAPQPPPAVAPSSDRSRALRDSWLGGRNR